MKLVTLSVRLSLAEAEQFCRRWLPAFSGGVSSLDTLLAFYAPDAQYSDPMVPNGVKGEQELRKFYLFSLSTFPDWKFELVEVFPTEKGFIMNYRARIPYKGRVIEDFTGLDVIELNAEGKISNHRGFFDTSRLDKELGISGL